MILCSSAAPPVHNVEKCYILSFPHEENMNAIAMQGM